MTYHHQKGSSMKYPNISAVILAGGRSSRMGGEDKGLTPFDGKPMIEHVIAVLATLTPHIMINANRNLERYQQLGYPVISDETQDYDGPLAGFLVAMEAAKTNEVLLLPCDSPLLSRELIDRLIKQKQALNAEIAVAHDGQRLQPVYALLSIGLKDSLRAFLAGGERKVDRWYLQHFVTEVDCSDIPEAFANINTPEELRKLEHARGSA